MADPKPTEDDNIQISLLQDEEIDELVTAGHITEEQRWQSPLDRQLLFKYDEISLSITPGACYPIEPPVWEVINHSMSIEPVDALRRRLRAIVQEAAEINTLERLRGWVNLCDGAVFQYTKVITIMIEEAHTAVENFRQYRLEKIPVRRDEEEDSLAPVFDFEQKDAVSIESLSSSELAYRYTGKTLQEIAALVPYGYRVRHIEEVIRKDLSRNFDACQSNIRNNLSKRSIHHLRQYAPPQLQRSSRAADYVEELSKPRLTFHGTQRQHVGNIVRHGFLRPGMKDPSTGANHDVRCGSTYGRGIYSSPDLRFSLSYSDWWCRPTQPDEYFGLKIIVCATLMGRARVMFRDDNWRTLSEPYAGADSHISNNNLEYIVFEPEQIIPVYVIHMDWGDDNAHFFQGIPDDPTQWTAHAQRTQPKRTHPKLLTDFQYAGDKKRAKEAVFAKAAKYFPYGFGPATGTRFVVEEVGEISEDDEEYGEYQELRLEKNNHDTNIDYWSSQKFGEIEDAAQRAPLADEYTDQRKSYGPAWKDIPLPGEIIAAKPNDDGDASFDLERLMGILKEDE